MVKIRFWGTLRLVIKTPRLEADASDINDLLRKLGNAYGEIGQKQFRNSTIFVNNVNIINLKLYDTKLIAGDTVDFFSPVSGG